jgi:transposase
MTLPPNRVRILVATRPVDFRKGHDGLAAWVENELDQNPFTGTVFVFRAKRTDRFKLLYWNGSGLVMTYKRLEDHNFAWPAVANGLMPISLNSLWKKSRWPWPVLGPKRTPPMRTRNTPIKSPVPQTGELYPNIYPKLKMS